MKNKELKELLKEIIIEVFQEDSYSVAWDVDSEQMKMLKKLEKVFYK
ncbi:MAG: hypothetical protein AABY15_01005 [Nanoarchaeota archaeon]